MRRRNMMLGLMAVPPVLAAPQAWAFGAGNGAWRGMFEWLPSECAHERWPMQLVDGEFAAGDGVVVPMPTGKIINNGLGEIGSRRLIGSVEKPVPTSARLRWYSFAEDAFFGGEIPLPHDELLRRFREGLPDPHHPDDVTWSKIVVGMGLGGWVHVWVSGGLYVREVARVRLAPVAVEWRRVIDNPNLARADHRRSVLKSRVGEVGLAALDASGPPVEQWPRYSQRYAWSVRPQTPHRPLDLLVRFVNGERHTGAMAASTAATVQPAPKSMQLTWQPASGSRLLTTIHFDEQEVLDLFDGVSEARPLALVMDYPGKTKLTVRAEVGGKSTTLTKARIDVNSLG